MTGGKQTKISQIFFYKYRNNWRGKSAQKAQNVKNCRRGSRRQSIAQRKSCQRLADFT